MFFISCQGDVHTEGSRAGTGHGTHTLAAVQASWMVHRHISRHSEKHTCACEPQCSAVPEPGFLTRVPQTPLPLSATAALASFLLHGAHALHTPSISQRLPAIVSLPALFSMSTFLHLITSYLAFQAQLKYH